MHQLQNKLWTLKVRVLFCIDSSLITGKYRPLPLPMKLSFSSYFPLVMPTVHKYLQQFVPDADIKSVWLSYNGKPLEWRHPIGVLYDVHVSSSQNKKDFKEGSPPLWHVTVHCGSFPHDDVMSLFDKQTMMFWYRSSCKEALHLRYRVTDDVNMAKDSDLNEMFEAATSASLTNFRRYFSKSFLSRASKISPAFLHKKASPAIRIFVMTNSSSHSNEANLSENASEKADETSNERKMDGKYYQFAIDREKFDWMGAKEEEKEEEKTESSEEEEEGEEEDEEEEEREGNIVGKKANYEVIYDGGINSIRDDKYEGRENTKGRERERERGRERGREEGEKGGEGEKEEEEEEEGEEKEKEKEKKEKKKKKKKIITNM
eukprot:MONOS_10552.1-p1 / transcript=MONOS_10552.1 / gene=MONOS_10552 / organism=Monocercomonoides_exilis_PA203 / gene_product=Autophagy-related protein 5A (Atg5A) / transcript_product=Autophagy-related protein 5A (Atg5A) / location=Mono_scaffold00484:16369-17722(+) / protein_length=375 / sequence_SO=supercontig / SO=protein_coding / is_pseudo=false